ncbi:MAG: GGDEF domain-containing protein, partial [Marinobacter sp.]|nr:GGDEF domain-containing protein [Marinobacter sp.]MDX5387294.1 GGDEF domain-containing protein [Marinobacter sp.]MDX5472653.1 GGDEF domain-containing protein [Marinobacter sp.]
FLDDIKLTASASVAEVCRGETWSVWLNRADQALYDAKAKGRNQVVNAARPSNESAHAAGPSTPAGDTSAVV